MRKGGDQWRPNGFSSWRWRRCCFSHRPHLRGPEAVWIGLDTAEDGYTGAIPSVKFTRSDAPTPTEAGIAGIPAKLQEGFDGVRLSIADGATFQGEVTIRSAEFDKRFLQEEKR